MKQLKRVIVFSVLVLCAGCAPLHVDYYQPIGEGEKVSDLFRPSCGGPKKVIKLLNIRDDVVLGLQFDKGILKLTFRVPENYQVRLVNPDIRVDYGGTTTTINIPYFNSNIDPTPIYNDKGRVIDYKYARASATEELQGGQHQSYFAKIKIPGHTPVALTVYLPDVDINGVRYQINKASFKKAAGVFTYSINC